MSNPRVSVSLGRTINLGNFNSLRVEVSLERDLYENESISYGTQCMYTEVREELTKIIAKEK
jgi:hypothetical protein